MINYNNERNYLFYVNCLWQWANFPSPQFKLIGSTRNNSYVTVLP